MLDLLLSYGWVVVGLLGVAVIYLLRLLTKRRLAWMVDDILTQAQSGFAKGDVEVYSVEAVRRVKVDDEMAVLYRIDATITPSNESVEWSGADLFLRGANGNPNQVGDVMTLQRWNGEAFEPLKNQAKIVGTQRLLLSMRFAGTPGNVYFNFNFANFGPVFTLPRLQNA